MVGRRESCQGVVDNVRVPVSVHDPVVAKPVSLNTSLSLGGMSQHSSVSPGDGKVGAHETQAMRGRLQQGTPVRQLERLGVKRKLFDGTNLQCSHCAKRGHTIGFCPVLATVPDDSAKGKFVRRVLEAGRVDVLKYAGMDLKQAKEEVEKLGRKFNEGNPLAESKTRGDMLTRRLGYWRAIGRTIWSSLARAWSAAAICKRAT